MIILIAGASHSGKTAFAQRLLERYAYPYLSIDHLKMGLIRSGYCPLSPTSPQAELTAWLWPVLREMIMTALENRQNLILEGCYIPPDWQGDFSPAARDQIRYLCLILSQRYIEVHYERIASHSCRIEHRLPGALPTRAELLRQNLENLELCKKYGLDYVLIEDRYEINWEL